MEAAWNRGDFPGYMAGFKKPDVVFVSRGQVQKDWQGTLDHYIRDYGGDAARRRGKLHFFDLRIDLLAPDAAMLTGRYRLEGGGRPQDGINTRLFRKVGGRWVIAINHVSSREPLSGSAAAGPLVARPSAPPIQRSLRSRTHRLFEALRAAYGQAHPARPRAPVALERAPTAASACRNPS